MLELEGAAGSVLGLLKNRDSSVLAAINEHRLELSSCVSSCTCSACSVFCSSSSSDSDQSVSDKSIWYLLSSGRAAGTATAVVAGAGTGDE